MSQESNADSIRREDIEAALVRAAARARKLATEAGRPIVLWKNGKIVKRFVADEQPVSSPPSDAA